MYAALIIFSLLYTQVDPRVYGGSSTLKRNKPKTNITRSTVYTNTTATSTRLSVAAEILIGASVLIPLCCLMCICTECHARSTITPAIY